MVPAPKVWLDEAQCPRARRPGESRPPTRAPQEKHHLHRPAEGSYTHVHGNNQVLQYCEEFRSPIARMRFPSKDELSSSHTCSSSGGAGLFHIVCGSGVGHNADVAFGSMLSKKSL